MADPRDTAKHELEKVLFKVHELEVTLANLTPTSQATLEEKLLSFANELGKLQQSTSSLAEYRVPVSLLAAVDQGMNPDSFTSSTFRGCLEQNQVTKGKVVAIESLRDKLLKEAAQEFPELVSSYQAYTAAPKPEQ